MLAGLRGRAPRVSEVFGTSVVLAGTACGSDSGSTALPTLSSAGASSEPTTSQVDVHSAGGRAFCIIDNGGIVAAFGASISRRYNPLSVRLILSVRATFDVVTELN